MFFDLASYAALQPREVTDVGVAALCALCSAAAALKLKLGNLGPSAGLASRSVACFSLAMVALVLSSLTSAVLFTMSSSLACHGFLGLAAVFLAPT